MAKVANSIHLGSEEDETAMAAKWHVPEAHYLESWSDARTPDGTVAIQQPMISPMYGGKTAAEVVALMIDYKDKSAHDIVKNYWAAQTASARTTKAWRKALHDGIVAAAKPAEAAKAADRWQKARSSSGSRAEIRHRRYRSLLRLRPSTCDGRFANNGWMQEAPDPMTKLTWGNAAMISPKTARDKNLSDGDMITLARGSYKLEAAVMVQPGQADNAITIALGYGRTACGTVGKGVGFNANGAIRTSDAMWFAPGYSITATGAKHTLATTQEHGFIGGINDTGHADRQNDRPVFREVTLSEFKKNAKSIEEMQEVPELHSIYPERVYDKGYQWGMAIDLNSCTGCNACVVACQAENNIPVVGKDQVMHGREMHWIRMDRYYVGTEDDPRSWSSSRFRACSAKTRPAKTSARWRPPRTAQRAQRHGV